jgi:hypothetical protein
VLGSAGTLSLAASQSIPTAYHSPGQVLAATSWIGQSGKIAGIILLAILVLAVAVSLMRRRQRQRAFATSRAMLESTHSRLYAPLIAPAEPGWIPYGPNPNEQGYWDGHGWIAHRRWSGAGWVEFSAEDLHVRHGRGA